MDTKTLEIRDVATLIPVLAIRMVADNEAAGWYIHERCGHPREGGSIVVMVLSNMAATNDPYEWVLLKYGSRTMPVAHQFIIQKFDELVDGDVVDVEFLLREVEIPKVSERFSRVARPG